MTKTEFLYELTLKIASLPQNEIDKSTAYYGEIIDDRIEDGMSEDAAVDALGDINVVVENIMYAMSLSTLMKAKVSESKNNSSNKSLWTVLVILGSPIWFPLLLALLIAILAVYITIWALIISLYAVVVSLGLSGIIGLIAGIVFCFIQSFPTGLCIIGMALCCIALTLFMILPVFAMTKGLVKSTTFIARKIKSLFITKKAVSL